jgi:hypothetical protein
LFALLLFATVFGCDSASVSPNLASDASEVVIETDPNLTKLLEFKIEKTAAPDFMKGLEAVAKKRGWQQQLAECKKSGSFDWDEARAELIRADRDQYAVILLKACTMDFSGEDYQTAILLDRQGKLLDRLVCEVNSKVTRSGFGGELHTVISRKPEADGAHLVIRLDGESARGNFAHKVYHGGREGRFFWGDELLPKEQPTVWDVNGLCRVAIKDRKFKVLFPAEHDKNWRPYP